jgi:hypothetical protein
MTGDLILNRDPTVALQAATKQYVDAHASVGSGVIIMSPTAPASPVSGQLWWDTNDGQLYVYYNDGNSAQWVAASTVPAGGILGTITNPQANDLLIYNGTTWVNARPKYNVSFSLVGGVLTAGQLLGIHCFTKGISFAANWAGYLGHVPEAGGTANATASTVITISRALAATPNTFASVGSITFAAGGIVPTFVSAGTVVFAAGDRMRLTGPATADTTFANFYCSLAGWET